MQQANKKHDPPNCVGYCLECEYGEMSYSDESPTQRLPTVGSHESVGQEIAMFGILDWEAAHERFQELPAADVYFDKSFHNRVVWYLAQGLYKMYYTRVQADSTQIQKCEQVFQAQGNNPDSQKEVNSERSMSMSDIVVLENHTVWLCSNGWICLNPGVIH